jgi:glycerophosphoryl diester phosphodiesterase
MKFWPVGHRGAGSDGYNALSGKVYWMENTLSSFRQAFESGAKMVEFGTHSSY